MLGIDARSTTKKYVGLQVYVSSEVTACTHRQVRAQFFGENNCV